MISFENLPYHPPAAAVAHPAGKREKTVYIINKVIQALDLLEQFHGEIDELSLTQLSKRLSLHENHLRPLVATLKDRNYLEQNPSTGGYRLGYKTLELAQTMLRQIDLYRVSHPVLSSIFAICGETTAAAVLSKSFVIELDAIHCEQPVRVVSRVGVHLPAYCTAAGKALLACEPIEELERLLEGVELVSYTGNTICSVQDLAGELRQIAQKGYAIDDREGDPEVVGIAAAIRDYAGVVVGAVAITAPSCRMTVERLHTELAPLVLQGAREISSHLGFQEAEPEADDAVASPGVAPSTRTRIPHQKRKPRTSNRAA
ncbi:IclR family transcriptional regulator [Geomonas sp.]|uniref:IclR family transcriptional regulator n=1 Tax=Geomonas sp. TaxID=2651584 RepID=UPI002B49C080|nr:IclR family transcriptional regulator [Geomonas sp.]HJV35452.1 IclR family transcriptional regulator [Geomonas sp.]